MRIFFSLKDEVRAGGTSQNIPKLLALNPAGQSYERVTENRFKYIKRRN